MPAYGQQIIPQVEQVGDPKIPKADMTVANNVAQQGAAGLAAFTQMAAMAQRGRLEQEQLTQQAALAMQGFAIKREDNALQYKMNAERLENAKSINGANLAWEKMKEDAYESDTSNFAAGLVNSPFRRDDPKFPAYVAQLVSDYPLVTKTAQGAKYFYEAMDMHEGTIGPKQAVQGWREARAEAGYNDDTTLPDIDAQTGKNGLKITVKTPKGFNEGVERKRQEIRHEFRVKAAELRAGAKTAEEKRQAEIKVQAHLRAAKAQEQYLISNETKDALNVPYKDSFKLEEARLQSGQAEAEGTPPPAATPTPAPVPSPTPVPWRYGTGNQPATTAAPSTLTGAPTPAPTATPTPAPTVTPGAYAGQGAYSGPDLQQAEVLVQKARLAHAAGAPLTKLQAELKEKYGINWDGK